LSEKIIIPPAIKGVQSDVTFLALIVINRRKIIIQIAEIHAEC